MPQTSLRRFAPQGCDLSGVERHRRHRPAIAGKHRGDARRQAAIAVEPALELDQHGDAAADEIAKFAERHHALGAAAKRHALELGGGEAIEPALAFGQRPSTSS